jgi:hypothetical protein
VSLFPYQRVIAQQTVRTIDQFVTLIDRIAVAQRELIVSYLRVGPQAKAWSSSATWLGSGVEDDAPDAAATSIDRTTPESKRIAVPADLVQARAYELYQRRGHQPGDPNDDWARAEAELLAANGGSTS